MGSSFAHSLPSMYERETACSLVLPLRALRLRLLCGVQWPGIMNGHFAACWRKQAPLLYEVTGNTVQSPRVHETRSRDEVAREFCGRANTTVVFFGFLAENRDSINYGSTNRVCTTFEVCFRSVQGVL